VWIAISTVITIVGIAGLAFVSTISPAIFILLIAVGLGAALTLGLTLPLDHTSSAEEANAWTVFSSLIGYLIAAIGPYGFGALRDLSGAFTIPYVLLFVVSLLMLALTPLLGPRAVPSGTFESSPGNEVI
jgi:CP family cyanate transporter-like MFS transporter